MIKKEEHIKSWIEQSKDDWEAVETLFRGRKYLQSLFFGHLVIEKLCKALWIKYNDSNIPPRTHNLLHILSQIPIEVEEHRSEFLLKLNRFQLEGRYPDHITNIKTISDESFTSGMIEEIKELKLWLLEVMQ